MIEKLAEAIEKIALVGAAVGGAYGALRKKDPGESRADAIVRSAGTGLATDLGSHLGKRLGASLAKKTHNPKIAIGLIAGGDILGSGIGYELAKRRPKKDK